MARLLKVTERLRVVTDFGGLVVFRREGAGNGRTVALIGAAAVVVVGAGVAVVMLTTSHGRASAAAAAAGPGTAATGGSSGGGQAGTVTALRVVSVSPADGAQDVNGAAPIRLALAAAAPGAPLPGISPDVAGTWQRDGAALIFTPQTAFAPHTRVTVTVPPWPEAQANPAQPGGAWTASFTTGTYSMLRLQQVLAQLGYLPLGWAADLGGTVSPGDVNAQLSAAYSPPVGAFTWHRGYPAALASFWRPGQANLITTGALMAFESEHGMAPDAKGKVSPALWTAVLRAAARQSMNANGYTYAIASKALPETLTIWHNGHEVFRNEANTGIPVSPTADGTFPVYLRYYFQVMKGTNPDGSHYSDPVYYVSYFNGGDAVHYFPRSTYGWPQSLGCVELPYTGAEHAYPFLTYGSLVTVRS